MTLLVVVGYEFVVDRTFTTISSFRLIRAQKYIKGA